jgi:hypothetical protein
VCCGLMCSIQQWRKPRDPLVLGAMPLRQNPLDPVHASTASSFGGSKPCPCVCKGRHVHPTCGWPMAVAVVSLRLWAQHSRSLQTYADDIHVNVLVQAALALSSAFPPLCARRAGIPSGALVEPSWRSVFCAVCQTVVGTARGIG